MALREAYENALEYADREEELLEENEIDLWIKKVNSIYENFQARNDTYMWNALLQDDICQNLESKNQVREALLVYFMEHYYLSHEVLNCLNEFFNFMEDLDELYEQFPRSFIDNIIVYRMKEKEYPDYDNFEVKENGSYDEFLELFYKLDNAIGHEEVDSLKEILEEIEELDISHPSLSEKKIGRAHV